MSHRKKVATKLAGAAQRVFTMARGKVRSHAAEPEATPNPPGECAAIPAAEDQVRLLAYFKWEAAGRPPGDGVEFWVEAERELRGG